MISCEVVDCSGVDLFVVVVAVACLVALVFLWCDLLSALFRADWSRDDD